MVRRHCLVFRVVGVPTPTRLLSLPIAEVHPYRNDGSVVANIAQRRLIQNRRDAAIKGR